MTNPSFEQDHAKPEGPKGPGWERKGPVPGWHVWIGSIARTGNPEVAWPRTAGRTGARCVSLAGCIGPVCVIQSVSVRPDRSYEARVSFKMTAPQRRSGLLVRFQTAEGKWAEGRQRVSPSADASPNEWTELRTVFTPPKDAAFAVFLLTADGQKSDETCWFDDASLTEMAPGELVVSPCGWIHPNCLPVGQRAETPHVPWAKPWAGGRLKVLFLIGSDHNLREPIELAQRMDIEYDYAFAHDFEPTVFALNDREITDRLRSNYYDVIVVGVNCDATMIVGLAERTRGLVLVRGPGLRPRLPAHIKVRPASEDSYLTEASDAFPALDEVSNGGVAGVRIGEVSSARVVEIAYGRKTYCLTPNVTFDEHVRVGCEYWEAYLQLLARAILHAGGCPPVVQAVLSTDGNGARLRLRSAARKSAVVSLRFRDRLGRTYGHRMDIENLAGQGDRGELSVDVPTNHPAGPSTVIATVRRPDGGSLGFAITRIDVVRPTYVAAVKPDRPYYEPGGPVIVKVSLAGDVSGTRVEASLTDAYGRTHAVASASGTSQETSVILSHERKLSAFNWLTVRLLRGSTELDAWRSYVLAPRSRQEFIDDYQVGTWACSSYLSAYLHPTLHRLMREAGITLGIQHSSVYASMLAGRMRLISTAYGRIPGYGRHRSTESVRAQCLNDPTIRERMADAARNAAEAELAVRPVFAYIRDETSLVRDALAVDVCACQHCAVRFRAWLRKRYGDIGKLNRHWRTNYASWDDVGYMKTESM